jgi:hypothetical protein
VPANGRERLKLEFARAAPLRELYPQLAQVRVEMEFRDDVSPAPSSQAFSYFPAARGFFRYSCPCHSCSGEFDLSTYVEELARKTGGAQRTRRVDVDCQGLRTVDSAAREDCGISAEIRVSAVLRGKDQTA